MDGMKQTSAVKTGRTLSIALGAVALAFVFLVVALLVIRVITGRGLGLRSLPRTILSTILAVRNREKVAQYNRGEYTDIIFLHHSTGNNLIEQGGVRELFTQVGYHFWDQSYNAQGLRDPDGNLTGYAYTVPGDNTDPDGLARVFRQKVYDLPINALSGLLQHEVIIIKSCFAPGNQIASDEQLEQLKQYYLGMREKMSQYPGKIFVIVTTPPLNPAETNPQEARRARLLANWLKSDEFLFGQSNIFVYDLFDQLAERSPSSPEVNMLRQEFRTGTDSHPNMVANQEIAPAFVDYIIKVIQIYRSLQ
jgi:hypothetical protein